MTAATATVPSLTQIEAWSTSHLGRAAEQWAGTAVRWEHAFTAVHREALTPGGTTWLGAAADAAALRTGMDRASVIRAADSLRAAAAAARSGVDEINVMRQLALRAIDGARAAGFEISEDLSAISFRVSGSRVQQIVLEAEAQTHASAIHMRAQTLVAVDSKVSRRVAAAIDGVRSVNHFDHVAARYVPNDSLEARQSLLMTAVRSLLDDGLVVVGGIVGGSDERVEPWDLSLDDAMDRIHDWYIVHHDDNQWVFGIWFAITDRGNRTAEALEAEESHG